MQIKRRGYSIISNKVKASTALIIMIGIVSLFADYTYEGGRSILPQFFTTTLGGSVFLLGIVLGAAEFFGYAFRLVSGKIADKTHGYWILIFLGYAMNLFALPLLAITGNYILAIFLIFAERVGKGIRAPPKDYIISEVAEEGKMGKAFAINEILDQTGAILGPLSVSLILLYESSYRAAFAFLAIPATVAIAFLVIVFIKYTRLKQRKTVARQLSIMPFRKFVIYSIAIAASAAGTYQVSFMLVTAQGVLSTYLIPLIFLVAMAGEGIFGFAFGLLYDRIGRKLVYLGLLFSLSIPILLLGFGLYFLFLGALMLGAATGIQDTVMRSVVGSRIKKEKRGYAFGVFNALYGFGLMASSITVGYLFYSLPDILIYVVAMQTMAFIALSISFKE